MRRTDGHRSMTSDICALQLSRMSLGSVKVAYLTDFTSI